MKNLIFGVLLLCAVLSVSSCSNELPINVAELNSVPLSRIDSIEYNEGGMSGNVLKAPDKYARIYMNGKSYVIEAQEKYLEPLLIECEVPYGTDGMRFHALLRNDTIIGTLLVLNTEYK